MTVAGLCLAAEDDRTIAERVFNELCRQYGGKSNEEGKAVRVEPVSGPNGEPCRSAYRAWLELVGQNQAGTGVYVSPSLHPWRPAERFCLHVQVAVLARLEIYQIFKNGQEPRRVWPDNRFPQGLQPLVPGQAYPMPVNFILDNNAETEYGRLIFRGVVSAQDPPPAGGGSTSNSSSNAPSTDDPPAGVLKGGRFSVSEPRVERSHVPQEAALVATSAGPDAQIDLVFRKTP